MFKFLKDKLKSAVSKFSKKVDKEGTEEAVEEVVEEKVEEPIKEVKVKKAKPKIEKKPEEKPKEDATAEEIIEEIKELPTPDIEEVSEEPEKELEKPKKKGFFKRLTQKVVSKKISADQFESMFEDLEITLLENNVALEVIEKIKEDLKAELVDTPITRGKVEDTIFKTLKNSVHDLFDIEPIDILEETNAKKPLVICMVGVNGSGKTTTTAKLAKYFLNNKKSVVLAAADTFRAAAIDQLQEHADKLDVKLIKHEYGSDPAAVAFDAVKHAEAKGIDVVLIDTAGRMHSNANLMDEVKKVIRVSKPHITLFVGEAITGNDCVEQARAFNDALSIDGIILTKQDIDEKGGASVSVSYITKKPILFIGTGQEYEDLVPFEPNVVLEGLGLH